MGNYDKNLILTILKKSNYTESLIEDIVFEVLAKLDVDIPTNKKEYEYWDIKDTYPKITPKGTKIKLKKRIIKIF